jgi:hypothetical protein
VIYFNLPENFFRSIDRHYMPSFVIFSIFIAYGFAALIQTTIRMKRVLVIVILLIVPVLAIVHNYPKIDGSQSYFAYDTAKNYLANLPSDAILFTQADIDTYTLWELQAVEHFRPDITVCNVSLMNTPWFIKQVIENDVKFPVKLTDIELANLSIIPWHDSTISLPVVGNPEEYGLPPDAAFPASCNLIMPATMQGKYLMIQDQLLLKILLTNNWKRPICFSSLLPQSNLNWLMPYLRLEGLYWRLVPARSNTVEIKLLSNNLINNYQYRGYTDKAVQKEEPTKWISWNYCSSFLTLASMRQSIGDSTGCRDTIDKMRVLLAPENLSLPDEMINAIADVCR